MTIHVVGAGLAGLSAAVALAARGHPVALYEAAAQAGGRCRSFFDETLGTWIDNGAHVVLGANAATFAFLHRIGTEDRLVPVEPAGFDFLDLRDGAAWTIRPNRGPLPWFLLAPDRRAPGTGLADYLWATARLISAAASDTVAMRLVGRPRAFETVWRPLAVAALNGPPETVSAQLFAKVLLTSFIGGAAGARPYLARRTLADSFVDPALAWLGARGVVLRTGARLRMLDRSDGRVTQLGFGDAVVTLEPADSVILAVPPAPVAGWLPELTLPLATAAILNLHYRWPGPAMPAMLGLIGGRAEWLFRRQEVASVTISAADALIDAPAADLAVRIWQEIAPILKADPAQVPPVRSIKEKRATMSHSPAELARRPAALTRWGNLFLAGDWTATGLPATIEGAIRSGARAARVAGAPEGV